MIKRIRDFFLTAVATAMFAVPVLVPAMASASIAGQLCAGSNASDGSSSIDISGSGSTSGCSSGNDANSGIQGIMKLVVNVFSIIVGFVAVVMIIVGGFKYITSGGDSGNISGAKNTIVYAIVGLIIVALAQVIVHFVLAKTSTVVGTN